MSEMETLDKNTLKVRMLLYWALLFIGIAVMVIAGVTGKFALIIVGLAIPGILGLIHSLKNFFQNNKYGFLGTIFMVWVFFIVWVALGTIFGLMNAIKYTNAFVKAKK